MCPAPARRSRRWATRTAPARHLRDGATGCSPGSPCARDLRRLRLAGRRAADRAVRPRARVRRRRSPAGRRATARCSPRARRWSRSTSTRRAGAHRPVDLARRRRRRRTARALRRARGVRCAASATDALAAEIAAGSLARRAVRGRAARTAAWTRATLSIALDACCPRTRTVAVDSGHFMGWPADVPARPRRAPGSCSRSVPVRSGSGSASAIGAAVARPDRLTVACLGDGGALMALPSSRPPPACGCRCSSWSTTTPPTAPRSTTSARTATPVELVQFPDTDFAALAEAAGARGVTVRATRGPRRDRARGWPSATARSSSMPRSRPTSARNGSRRRSAPLNDGDRMSSSAARLLAAWP